MIYYYIHTGHRFGLDRFRKAVSIINSLPELKIKLLTSDFRIASSARDFGIHGAIGIDVLRNIPNVAEHGDILIYDSDEHNENQLNDMINYFSKFIRISINQNDFLHRGEYLINPHLQTNENVLSANPVSDIFFGDFDKQIERTFFYGDDDYEKYIFKNGYKLGELNSDLLMGFYYFLGYEKELKSFFKNIHETEDYENIIKKSKVLITSSFQTALETLASGGIPIFVEREDRSSDQNAILEKLNVPVLNNFDRENIENAILSAKPKKLINQNELIREKILFWLNKK